jgi:hypothetical protein
MHPNSLGRHVLDALRMEYPEWSSLWEEEEGAWQAAVPRPEGRDGELFLRLESGCVLVGFAHWHGHFDPWTANLDVEQAALRVLACVRGIVQETHVGAARFLQGRLEEAYLVGPEALSTLDVQSVRSWRGTYDRDA